VRIDDVSPRHETANLVLPGTDQSVSGKAYCVATSPDGRRAYLGGQSGVWRSSDGGATWSHPEWMQPPPGQTTVPGALMVPSVFDLLVSPTNRDIVLAATGRDPRRPDHSGIYRSTNGARTWTRVHQFVGPTGEVGVVGSLAAAPDDPAEIFAGGSFALGLSRDGGQTWSERVPQTRSSDRVYHVAVGPMRGTPRFVFAVGSRVWYSADGGEAWTEDAGGPATGSPDDATSSSSRAIAIHPTQPNVLYVKTQNQLWRGTFPTGGSGAEWRQLPLPRTDYAGTTASGADYIVAHAAPGGQLLLIVSDRRTVHIANGEPASTGDWTRIDGEDIHVDPHGLAPTPDFRRAASGPAGRVLMVNDGGVYFSTDGARTWTQGRELTTLGSVNAAVLPEAGGEPAICIGTGDNNGFYTRDGGRNWESQDYWGGDNDCCFADPRQPNRLLVFAPRADNGRRQIFLYAAPAGELPDAARGTSQRQRIPGPPPLPGQTGAAWNAISPFFHRGYRPLVLTLDSESPRPDGDFVTIRRTPALPKLLRTTAMSQITSSNDWVTSATAEGPGVKVFQVGPELPDAAIDVVQPSGGHRRPTFYVGDPDAGGRVWKWTAGMQQWQRIVPGPNNVPAVARRFFVDPYRPQLVYVLDSDHVRRSDDGGSTWTADESLERALTQARAFPFSIPYDGNPAERLLRDMLFDHARARYRFAVGPAGVFYTLDGRAWRHLILSAAVAALPNNAAYDPFSDRCNRALYVTTSNRGLLRLRPLPPDWDFPMGSVQTAVGRITLLRAHEVGTKYGPPDDQIDAEAIVWLDTEREKAFGLQLRADAHEDTFRGMLDLLRDAFNQGRRVRVEYARVGCRVGRIMRVIDVHDSL
jgi:hypothetical protein